MIMTQEGEIEIHNVRARVDVCILCLIVCVHDCMCARAYVFPFVCVWVCVFCHNILQRQYSAIARFIQRPQCWQGLCSCLTRNVIIQLLPTTLFLRPSTVVNCEIFPSYITLSTSHKSGGSTYTCSKLRLHRLLPSLATQK